jgi:hypothetical protein
MRVTLAMVTFSNLEADPSNSVCFSGYCRRAQPRLGPSCLGCKTAVYHSIAEAEVRIGPCVLGDLGMKINSSAAWLFRSYSTSQQV